MIEHCPSSPSFGPYLRQGIERELGYAGQDRFVLFYYDPRSQQVVWRDTCAAGTGAAAGAAPVALIDQIEASARACGLSVGHKGGAGDHALLVDRLSRHAAFTVRERAQEFLARRSMVA